MPARYILPIERDIYTIEREKDIIDILNLDIDSL